MGCQPVLRLVLGTPDVDADWILSSQTAASSWSVCHVQFLSAKALKKPLETMRIQRAAISVCLGLCRRMNLRTDSADNLVCSCSCVPTLVSRVCWLAAMPPPEGCSHAMFSFSSPVHLQEQEQRTEGGRLVLL